MEDQVQEIACRLVSSLTAEDLGRLIVDLQRRLEILTEVKSPDGVYTPAQEREVLNRLEALGHG